MRSLILVALALGCSSAPQPEDVGSYRPTPAATVEEPAPEPMGTGGAPETMVTAPGSGGMLAMGGMGGEPVAGMGGVGGIQSIETLAGMGGQPVAAPCCSGVYNQIGQCIDDGSVCGGGTGGMAPAPLMCKPTPDRVCNTDGFGKTQCRLVCVEGWCHYDGTSGTCVPS